MEVFLFFWNIFIGSRLFWFIYSYLIEEKFMFSICQQVVLEFPFDTIRSIWEQVEITLACLDLSPGSYLPGIYLVHLYIHISTLNWPHPYDGL